MGSKLNEAASWDIPAFPATGPAPDFKDEHPSEAASESGDDSAFNHIEAALRDVAYQLGESEHIAGHDVSAKPETASASSDIAYEIDTAERPAGARKMSARALTPSVRSATKEYTRSFHELAHRIDDLEKNANTESLRDELRGLRQRLLDDSEQFNQTLDDSTGKVSTFAKAVEKLSKDVIAMRDRSAQLGNTLEESLKELSQKVGHSETHIGETEKRVQEKVESQLTFAERDMEKFSKRLERAEMGREEKDQAIKQALIALLAKLKAEKERNKNALAEVHTMLTSSLEEMKHGLGASEYRLREIVEGSISGCNKNIEAFKQQLSQTDQSGSEKSRALTEALDALRKNLDAEKSRSEGALSEVRSTLTSSLVSCLAEMKQSLDASEKRIQERLESRISVIKGGSGNLNRRPSKPGSDAKDNDHAFGHSIEMVLEQLSGEKKRSVEALANVHASLSTSVKEMKQSLDASEKRVEQKLENRFSTFDGKFDDLSERLDQAETGRIRSDDNFSELIDSMSRRLEQIEKDRSAGDSSLGESVDKITRRLEQVDQDRTSNERTISEAVGNIARRLEQVEQDRPANAQPVDLDASSIPTRLAQLEQDQSDNSSAENNQFAELRDQLVAEKTRNQEALTEIRSTLAEIKDELGNPASTQTRSSYSDLGIENISDSTDVSGTDREGNDRSVTEIIEELTAVHEADIAPSDKSSEDDLPEHRDSVEAMSAAPSPFELPPIDPSDPVSLAAEGMRASAPEDDESDLDEEPLEDQDDSDVTEDYLSEARRAAQAAADAAPAAGTQSSPLQSLKTRLMGSEAKLQLSQKNKIAAIAAALLLLVGGAAVLFLRGSETVPNDRIAGVVTAVPVEQPSLEASLAATPSLEQGADEAIFPGSETAELTPVPTTVSTDALAEDVNASTVSGPAMSAPQASVTGGQTPLETLVSQARGGSSPAALILGLKYLNGDGVAASESEAFR